MENNIAQSMENFKQYLLEEERVQSTIKSYIASVGEFFTMFSEVNKPNMIDFKQKMIKEKAPGTAHLRCVAMNQYCEFIGHPEYRVKAIKIQKAVSIENVITLEEYHRLLDGLQKDGNERGYWMIKFLAKTGARVSEFVQMPKSSLARGYCEFFTKGKIRRIYIPRQLIEESRQYFEGTGGEYLFCSKNGGQISTRGISEDISRWCKRYGIRKEVAHPHSFRHLYAIEFLQHNSNISLLADLMGHSSVNTTSIYLRLSKEEQIKQLNEASNW